MTRFFIFLATLGSAAIPAFSEEAQKIGDRRELFVEDSLIESISGNASLRLHHPTPREIVIEHDEP